MEQMQNFLVEILIMNMKKVGEYVYLINTSMIVFQYFSTLYLTLINSYSTEFTQIIQILWIPIQIFYIMVAWSLFKCSFTDPGRVPKYYQMFFGQQLRNRYCLFCHQFMPNRCHHCFKCKRCVLKMDHHSFLIGNCVGFYNSKFFLLFWFYLHLSSIFSLLIISLKVLEFQNKNIIPILLLQYYLLVMVVVTLMCLIFRLKLVMSNNTIIGNGQIIDYDMGKLVLGNGYQSLVMAISNIWRKWKTKRGWNQLGAQSKLKTTQNKGNQCDKNNNYYNINISHPLFSIQLIKMEANQVNDQVIKQLLYSKKYKELVDTATELGLVKSYQKMKYDGIIYSVGQIVQLSIDGNRDKKIYGKLIGFCNLLVEQYLIPMIKVQKYINKLELPQKLKELQEGISEFELFQSEIEEWLFCTQIDHEIKLISIKEYEEMTIQNERTYFTRADYNLEKDKFTPPISKWTRICICNQISNPDKSYIQCDKCSKWLHYECAGVQAQLAQDMNFQCAMCRKK